MDHLEEAKKWTVHYEEKVSGRLEAGEQAKLHALISIAESLKKIADGMEMPRYIIEIPEE